jgi:transketolase
MMKRKTDLKELCVNTIRMLAVDAVEKAKSGHPGMPLGAAPIIYILFTKFLRHNPENPKWFNRDRFVLSAGHGSALLYAVLHLCGYDLSLDELKNFRQWESKTPGHPEYWCAPGVEATTGPLGQGFGMGVGMAIAERFLAARYNKKDYPLIDHYTYAVVSDGDLMEGVSSEAASLAGHLGLGKLIYLYDDNHVSIEGSTDLTFTEDVCKRFEAYRWHVQRVSDGNDLNAIETAVKKAQKDKRPSLIAVRTHIGFGSPKQDSASAHGEPLGADALKKTKKFFRWPEDKLFYVPDEVKTEFIKVTEKGKLLENEWLALSERYRESFPSEYREFENEMKKELPAGWERAVPVFEGDAFSATRESSGKVINALAKVIPNIIGGSCDLAPSTKTIIEGGGDAGPQFAGGRNIHFGVREHSMGTIVNGMALHGGAIPYGSTFLVFSDYMRPPIRLAAMMGIHSIFIFTHDSIGLGEDGPTHQPVEQLMSLRAIPNLIVIRPADANETAAAWRIAIERKKPVALILTRQKVPILVPSRYPVIEGVSKGAYILIGGGERPDIILAATGSEVHLAVAAHEKLKGEGINARVVSMPSWELFEEQSKEYRQKVLPHDVPKLAVEAGITLGWQKWTGGKGAVIGIDGFGASAPGDIVMEKFGFTVENVVSKAKGLCGK